MNAIALPAPAAGIEGGFYAGLIQIAERQYAIIVSPKAEGDLKETRWHKSNKDVSGATSWNDGLANTEAMLEAGSPLAKKVRELAIGGFTDWYLPSLDELELCYRAFKPTGEQNSQWARSGINLSAVPPTYPYTLASPVQTDNELFRPGGSECFEASWYWSSSQHASDSGYAWGQGFNDGLQYYVSKTHDGYRARVVRRISI